MDEMICGYQYEHSEFFIYKNINLADAAVSILSLQVALIATFSSDSKMLTMNIVTGSVVSLGVIAIGLFMIVNSTKKIKLLKKQEEMNSK